MLPYSPLHHLLLRDVGEPLVMTSGNVSDEPIAYRDDDALERLGPIADLVLGHDRPIQTRTDDSVLADRARTPAAAAALPRRASPACSRCRSRQAGTCSRAAPSSRARSASPAGAAPGSATTSATSRTPRRWPRSRRASRHFERLFAVEPGVVAHDLHPDYLSTTYALAREGVEHVAVQHHHAHLAACLAEHGETGPAVGAIFDGSGLGTDGTVWGGEILVGDVRGFERAGHLWPVPLPGGDQAVREPWRMACAWLLGGRR